MTNDVDNVLRILLGVFGCSLISREGEYRLIQEIDRHVVLLARGHTLAELLDNYELNQEINT